MTALTFFIMPTKTTLYDDSLAAVVDLPAGYFVLQSDTAAPDGYLKVVYDDIDGYVRSDSVKQVDYTPVTKYETKVKFRCDNDSQPVNLRSEPRRAANVIMVLAATDGGHSYGATLGDELISGAGNVWYYVNVNGTRGYCYSAHIEVESTPPNIIEKEEPPNVPTDTKPVTEEPESMPGVAAIIFIVALCLPVPFIMFYLFRKPKEKE